MPTTTETSIPPLRAVRQAHGLGLREVASRAEIDAAQLSRVERGQSGLSVESLLRLARVLSLRELEKLITPYARDTSIGLTNDAWPADETGHAQSSAGTGRASTTAAGQSRNVVSV